MRLAWRRGGRHAAGTAQTVQPPTATPPVPRPRHPRARALDALENAAPRFGMSAVRERDAVALSVVGVPPIKVRVDYQHGTWCYAWTTQNTEAESLGPVTAVNNVLRLIAWTLNTGGAR